MARPERSARNSSRPHRRTRGMVDYHCRKAESWLFAAGADAYLKLLEDSAGKNIAIKRRQLRMYLKPFFGTIRLDAITSFTVDRYKKRRINAGAAKATINRELSTLSHLFSVAVHREVKWLDQRPCEIEMYEEGPGRRTALTNEQSDALMRAGK